MGFLQALHEVGKAEMGRTGQVDDLTSHLKPPLEREGRAIRVFLDIENPFDAAGLRVRGVKRADIADVSLEPEMLRKYLYRNPVGSNVAWAFTPIHKLGQPKKSKEKNLEILLGKNGDWEKDEDSRFYKMKYKLLMEYENAGVFSPGAVDRVMKDLEQKIEAVLSDLDASQPHIIIFGGEEEGRFLYPGEMPAFVKFFKERLNQTLVGKDKGSSRKKRGKAETPGGWGKVCAICGQGAAAAEKGSGVQFSNLNQVFKFSTQDKVNFLPALDKNEGENVFPVCLECLGRISAGRGKVERDLTNASAIPELRVWVVPEVVEAEEGESGRGRMGLREILQRLEETELDENLATVGKISEQRFFSRLARQGKGLVFHFLFWERNNAQEMVHLMVEDVPPERLAFLEVVWGEALEAVLGDVDERKGLKELDAALCSIYLTLNQLAGKSSSDRQVFRDFALKVIGKMLLGEKLPLEAFKKLVASRAARMAYESDSWGKARQNLLYAQVWAEFMQRVNSRLQEGGPA